MLVDVLLPLNFNQLFTYKSNIDLDEGDVVRLNFKNKEVVGVIWKNNVKLVKKNIAVIRPNDGPHPRHYESLIGKTSSKDYSKFEALNIDLEA